ncbi:hypothetical protein PGT21_009495 [Puccinia graminis f. sp. tritici]|uniref:Uncharacterized protein n=1 Tax=Puccinia graminis f. sp. tritici TaxID=56615 RepID=A0A5B0MU15_PUCGR|nr:hypothetical protein PGT21_009495 [Puccinia graminis f. sp. tritici]KAA1131464.1 hypothetical protein PGTUg99_017360 [Puccinia graminis f. sp. tritici]
MLQEYLDALEKLYNERLGSGKSSVSASTDKSHSQRFSWFLMSNLTSLSKESFLDWLSSISTHRYCDISPAKRVQAINSRSDEEAEEILEYRVRSVIRCRRIRSSVYRFPVYGRSDH